MSLSIKLADSPNIQGALVSKTLDFTSKKKLKSLISKFLNQYISHKRSAFESGMKNIKILESKAIEIISKCEYKILNIKRELRLPKLQKIKKSINKELRKSMISIENMILSSFKELDQISQEASSFFYKTSYTANEIANLKSLLSIDINVSEIGIFKDIENVTTAFENITENILMNIFPNRSSELLEKELGIIAEGHSSQIKCIVISDSCEFFLTGSADCTIKLWNLAAKTHKFTFYGHKGSVTALALTKNDEKLISVSEDCSIMLWNIKKRSLVKEINSLGYIVSKIELSYDDKYFLTLSTCNELRHWDLDLFGEMDSYVISENSLNFFILFEKHSVIVLEPGILLYKDILGVSNYLIIALKRLSLVPIIKISHRN
ncbi:hypothetical protein SteCoe_28728 [Stentor coeruleus]|uniref:Uncharacterized protein n=1 Tax=Stentor coeruleus TaxID=5963 RepID=A0A1R2B7J4_9CILI|nr:hypothetical protein SteCoe_28728 [Stentor coeruleus]